MSEYNFGECAKMRVATRARMTHCTPYHSHAPHPNTKCSVESMRKGKIMLKIEVG